MPRSKKSIWDSFTAFHVDGVYDQEKQKVKQQVQKAHVTLAIDGWSTLTNDPVLGISFYQSGVCYLVNTINTSGEPHTSDYLVQVVKDQIAYVEDEFGVKVTSFVTDNAANMNLMRREIRQGLDGVIHTYGCHAHIANLLSKDILRSNQSNAGWSTERHVYPVGLFPVMEQCDICRTY